MYLEPHFLDCSRVCFPRDDTPRAVKVLRRAPGTEQVLCEHLLMLMLLLLSSCLQCLQGTWSDADTRYTSVWSEIKSEPHYNLVARVTRIVPILQMRTLRLREVFPLRFVPLTKFKVPPRNSQGIVYVATT